jgi:hypothetical protein
MNKIISASLVLGAAWSLVGCGGGGDLKTVTKVIVDDPIVGLGYKCSSSDEMKKTNAEGEFTCNVGDSVTFYIGKYEIGSAETSSGSVDTMRIADLGVDGDAAVTDIRQVLQTINDQSGDGVIVIPEGFSDLDDLNTTPGSAGFEAAVELELDEELIDEATANKNADEAYQKYLLAGKTFYFVSHAKATPAVIEVRFNEALSQASYFKDSILTSENELDLNGSQITQHGDATIVFTTEEKVGYIAVHAEKNGYQFDAKMYRKKSDAQAQYDEETATTSLTEAMLEEKVFYKTRDDDGKKIYQVAKYDFPNVEKIEKYECPCSEEHGWITESYMQTIGIEDGKLKITTNHHGVYYISLHEVNGEVWNVFYEGDTNSDGMIDQRGSGVWHTVKPEDFPDFPDF